MKEKKTAVITFTGLSRMQDLQRGLHIHVAKIEAFFLLASQTSANDKDKRNFALRRNFFVEEV